MNKFFKFQKNHRPSFLIIIFIITAFFLLQATKLQINADFSSLFKQTPAVTYYGGGVFNEQEFNSILSEYDNLDKIDPQTYANIPIDDNYNAESSYNYPKTNERQKDMQTSSGLLLLITSDKFFTPVFLNTLDICLNNLKNLSEVQSYSSVFNYFTIEKKGSRLSLVPFSPNVDGTKWSDEMVSSLRNRLVTDPTATGYMVSRDLKSVIFNVRIGNLDEKQIYELLDTLAPLKNLGATFAITGLLPITYRITYYLSHDLALLLILSLIVILIVFYFSFRAKRSMFLPFTLSVLAIIWTFGTMVLLGFEVTLINIVTPCMVLTLGSSYSVHILNEYYAEYNKGTRENLPFIAATKISHTILFAGITTILGFLSLLISQIEGLKEFGISVSIGIIYCVILSLTFVPIMLSYTSKPKEIQATVVDKGLLTQLIQKISNIVLNHYIVFSLLFLIIFGGFLYTKDKVSVDTNYMAYFPKTDRIANDTKEISKALGGDLPYQLKLQAPEGSDKYFLNPENLKKVNEFEEAISKSPDILQDISFPSYVAHLNSLYTGDNEIPENSALINLFSRIMVLLRPKSPGLVGKIISEDSNTLNIYLQCYDSNNNDITTVGSSAKLEKLMASSRALLPEGVSITYYGTNPEALRFSNQLMRDQRASQILAYLLVLIIAALAFKSLFRGILTLIPVAIGVMSNYIFMYTFNIPFDMVTVSFASVAIGAGVDDAIHFLLKYTNLKKNNIDKTTKELLSKTLRETGRPIMLTTFSIVLGMLMLTFGSYTPIKYFGLLMSTALMNSMLATIFVLPAIILLLDNINNKLRK
ncbi:MAG: MMPL family transporter [Spirochaetaceae bacterium]|nr:MMPL family transporter [Spirochaetaceae bacterium]